VSDFVASPTQPRFNWADFVLGLASACLLLLLMSITVVDVALRYLFAAPLRGAFELTELALLILIFAGLPLVSRANEHVTIDFIDHILPGRAQNIVVRAIHGISAAAMLLLAWFIWLKAQKIGDYGDMTDSLQISMAPFVYFMAVMIAATGAVHIWKILAPGPPMPPSMT
jgi:TRAP-type C4-dicarboxylate transport system permease small subunit